MVHDTTHFETFLDSDPGAFKLFPSRTYSVTHEKNFVFFFSLAESGVTLTGYEHKKERKLNA